MYNNSCIITNNKCQYLLYNAISRSNVRAYVRGCVGDSDSDLFSTAYILINRDNRKVHGTKLWGKLHK